jgi:hypothetical protein
MISVLNDFFTHMNTLLNDTSLQPIEPHYPMDIHANFESLIDLSSILNLDEFKKQRALSVDDVHRYYSNLDMSAETLLTEANLAQANKLYNFSHFCQMDAETSRNFLDNCHKMQRTVQSIQLLSYTICLLNEYLATNSSNGRYLSEIKETLEFFNFIPCDMRPLFGLPKTELLECFGMLKWHETLTPNETLWKIGRRITERLQTMKRSNEGIKYWVQCKYGLEIEDLGLTCSSLGKLKVGEEPPLNKIKLEEIRFFTSSFRDDHEVVNSRRDCYMYCCVFFYVFTFLGKINMNFSHGYPYVSTRFGAHIARNLFELIRFFSKPDSINATILDLDTLLPQYKHMSHK